MIDKMAMQDSKQGRTHLGIAWIDYRKAYEVIQKFLNHEALRSVWTCQEYNAFPEDKYGGIGN